MTGEEGWLNAVFMVRTTLCGAGHRSLTLLLLSVIVVALNSGDPFAGVLTGDATRDIGMTGVPQLAGKDVFAPAGGKCFTEPLTAGGSLVNTAVVPALDPLATAGVVMVVGKADVNTKVG
jgi:hypothetical protein